VELQHAGLLQSLITVAGASLLTPLGFDQSAEMSLISRRHQDVELLRRLGLKPAWPLSSGTLVKN
jgi:hypothetical protein